MLRHSRAWLVSPCNHLRPAFRWQRSWQASAMGFPRLPAACTARSPQQTHQRAVSGLVSPFEDGDSTRERTGIAQGAVRATQRASSRAHADIARFRVAEGAALTFDAAAERRKMPPRPNCPVPPAVCSHTRRAPAARTLGRTLLERLCRREPVASSGGANAAALTATGGRARDASARSPAAGRPSHAQPPRARVAPWPATQPTWRD